MNKFFSTIFNGMMLACLSQSVYGYDLNDPKGLEAAVEQIGKIHNKTTAVKAKKDIAEAGKTMAETIIDSIETYNKDTKGAIGRTNKLIVSAHKIVSDKVKKIKNYRKKVNGDTLKAFSDDFQAFIDGKCIVKDDDHGEAEALMYRLEALRELFYASDIIDVLNDDVRALKKKYNIK